MAFVLLCRDKPGALDVRKANRAAHLDFIAEWGEAVRLAGPLLGDDGESMIGSLIVLDVTERAEADRFVAGDPYGLAHLFESVTVHPYRIVVGND